jgi:hypothetical protein
MSKKTSLSLSSVKKSLAGVLTRLGTYKGFLFFLVLTGLYAFIIVRINMLSSAAPSQADITAAQQSITHPKISDATVRKLQSLEDNSVRVQALFNEARQSPFQE